MIKPMPIDAQLSPQDRYGRQLAARLDASTLELPHDIHERLRVARLRALDQYRTRQTPALASVALSNSGAALLGGSDEERGMWPRLISLVPLLALVAGLIALQVFGNDNFAEEMAEIDAAILTDDLPPDAYTDPGFAQFLKTRLDTLKQN